MVKEDNFKKPLPQLTNMLRLESPDGRFAIYTWQRPNADRRYDRYGLVVEEFKGETKVIELAWELAKRDKAIAVLQEKIRLYEGGEKLKEKWEELENVNNESNTSTGTS